MDVRTGRIYTADEAARLIAALTDKRDADNLREMNVAPTGTQLSRRPPKVGRNERCPCGSGEKFKRCCLNLGPAP